MSEFPSNTITRWRRSGGCATLSAEIPPAEARQLFSSLHSSIVSCKLEQACATSRERLRHRSAFQIPRARTPPWTRLGGVFLEAVARGQPAQTRSETGFIMMRPIFACWWQGGAEGGLICGLHHVGPAAHPRPQARIYGWRNTGTSWFIGRFHAPPPPIFPHSRLGTWCLPAPLDPFHPRRLGPSHLADCQRGRAC